jgi:hypothetical protein
MEKRRPTFVGSLIRYIPQSTRFIRAEPNLLIERFRKPEQSDVDEALLKWFKQDKGDEVSLSVPFLMVTFVLAKF